MSNTDVVYQLSLQIADDLVESCNALCLEVNRFNESEKIQEITKLEKQLQDARRTEDVQLQANLEAIPKLESQLKEAQKCEEFAKLKKLNSKTIIDLLDRATLNRMIDKIRDDKGRVKFKTNWVGFNAVKVAMHTPLFNNAKIIEFVESFFPELIQQVGSFALASCASNCNIQVLTASVKQLIHEINGITTSNDKPINVFVKINETFELKEKSAGGRKQKTRRGHKQKSRRGHKQKTRRGHKTRRHRHRRSTRKH